MSLQITRTDAAGLTTVYAGVAPATVFLRIERVVFDYRQDTLDYDFSAYVSLPAMTAAGTASLPIPELIGLPTIKSGLSGIDQNGSQLAICYTHLKGLLAAVAGSPYTVTDI